MFSQLSDEVFGIELLLEKILDYAINGEYSGTEIQKFRLVNKTWLVGISKLLRKNFCPLYNIALSTESLVKGAPLNQFLNAVTGNSRIEPFIPPISLKLKTDFFREENYQNLLNILEQCGSSLVNLKILFPSYGGTIPFLINKPSFPNLRRLTVIFDPRGIRENAPDVVNNDDAVYLLKLILDSTKVLKYFTAQNNSNLPSDFGYLPLPSSIEFLHLRGKLSNKDTKILAENPLPNLKSLKLFTCLPYPNGFIFETLQRFSKTLEDFQFKGNSYIYELLVNPIYYAFPPMKKLRSFQTDRKDHELDDSVSGCLDKLLPMMENLELSCQTRRRFQKWTVSSKFENVNDLTILLVDETRRENGDTCCLNADSGIMQSLNIAFPNVRKLKLEFTMAEGRRDISGIQFLFREMKQLEKLSLAVYENRDEQNSNFWDSLLIGVPINGLENVRRNLTPTEHLMENFAESPSIINLKELKQLTLRSSIFPLDACPLISDVVFNLAFLKMPNLKTLELYGKFKASDKMVSKWTVRGRTINTKWNPYQIAD